MRCHEFIDGGPKRDKPCPRHPIFQHQCASEQPVCGDDLGTMKGWRFLKVNGESKDYFT